MLRLCLCKQKNICMNVELHVSLRKRTSKIGVKFFAMFFTFFFNAFMKTLIRSIIYCQTVPLNRLIMYVVKTVCQVSLSSFIVSLEILHLDQCQMEIFYSVQHHCHW